MTDKQIIIDEVDVLKEKINMCFILLSHKLETSETIEQTIYDHLDVFVEEWNKQLKRKEQEYERLEYDYQYQLKNTKKWIVECENLQQQLDQLKQTNEELRKCYKNNSVLLDFEETNTTKLVNKVMKLEKTLTEIKEIANYSFNRSTSEYMAKLELISEKISEVENENS